jgi:flagellar basal-body rod protein FlgC
MFSSITTAGTGLTTYRTWVDAIANNMANMNDLTPTSGKAFQAQFVQAQPIGEGPDGVGTGVQITDLPLSSAAGQLYYDPRDPQADKDGYVRRPDIDLGQQMGNLIMAQRAFQANSQVVDSSKEMYEYAIGIGKGM